MAYCHVNSHNRINTFQRQINSITSPPHSSWQLNCRSLSNENDAKMNNFDNSTMGIESIDFGNRRRIVSADLVVALSRGFRGPVYTNKFIWPAIEVTIAQRQLGLWV